MNREDVAPLCCLPAGMRVWLVTGLLSCLGLAQAQPLVLEGGAMAGSFANGPAYTGSLFLTGVPPSAAVLLTSDNSRPSLVLTSLTGTGAALSANLTYGSAIQGRGKVDGLVDGPPISVTSTATLSTNARSTPLTLPPSGFSANLETFGALSVRSLGVNQSSGWGGAGGAVNLQILAGTLSVGIPSTGPGAGVGPVWQPWASAI